MLFNVQDFSKCVLGLVGCSNLRFSKSALFHKHTGLENQPGLGQKVSGHSQEEFQRIFGFSKNRTTTPRRLVCALEALYQAQN